jgi:mannose-6-phosphate isomerase
MSQEPLYPLAFQPIFKSLLWGGRRLGTVLNKPIGAGDRYAESWELADHRDDVSRVRTGPLAGADLRTLVRNRGDELLAKGRGRIRVDAAHGPREQFPLLVKFLDAHDVLSVQVHPGDELGSKLAGDNGKTETWVIVHAEPGSLIYAGLKPGVTRNVFAGAMKNGDVEPLLHRFESRTGDCILIPAGTVHAIGAGVLLAEIQQTSDATFRVFDWNRVGPDGAPRDLHPDEALESIDFDAGPVNPIASTVELIAGGTLERLASCSYFVVNRLRLTGPATVGRADRFTIVVALGGAADLFHESGVTRVGFGQTVLLPAAIGPCEVVPQDGDAVLLTCVVP